MLHVERSTSASAPPEIDSAILHRFGVQELRPFQEEVIPRVLSAESDILLSHATGSGKSLCYQLPAALRKDGVVLVVSPLISLMRDQVRHLDEFGIGVSVLDSMQGPEERARELERVMSGKSRLLYIAPERLTNEDLLAGIPSLNVWLMVVDEVHCASLWGHDFRPDYLKIPRLRAMLGSPKILGLTATAPRLVRDDLVSMLELRNPQQFHGSITRSNIELSVERHPSEAKKAERVMELLSAHSGEPGSIIVYTATIGAACTLHRAAEQAGFTCGLYHGRLSASARERSHFGFLDGTQRIMFATNAFGMGIDKPDVRTIIHYQVPGSLENYYQEIGRAGRDGRPARAVLLYLPDDFSIQREFILGANPDLGEIERMWGRLVSVLTNNGAKSFADDYYISEPMLLDKSFCDYTQIRRAWSCLSALRACGMIDLQGSRLRFRTNDEEVSRDGFPLRHADLARKLDHALHRLGHIHEYAESARTGWEPLQRYFELDRVDSGGSGVRLPAAWFDRDRELTQALKILAVQDLASGPLTEALKNPAGAGIDDRQSVPGISLVRARKEIERGIAEGLIERVSIGSHNIFTLSPRGIERLERMGIEVAPPQNTEELTARIHQAPARELLRTVIRPLLFPGQSTGRVTAPVIDSAAQPLLPQQANVFGNAIYLRELAGIYTGRESAAVDHILLRVFLKGVFREELAERKE